MTGKIKQKQFVAIRHVLNVTLKLQEKLEMKLRKGKTLQGTLGIGREWKNSQPKNSLRESNRNRNE